MRSTAFVTRFVGVVAKISTYDRGQSIGSDAPQFRRIMHERVHDPLDAMAGYVRAKPLDPASCFTTKILAGDLDERAMSRIGDVS